MWVSGATSLQRSSGNHRGQQQRHEGRLLDDRQPGAFQQRGQPSTRISSAVTSKFVNRTPQKLVLRNGDEYAASGLHSPCQRADCGLIVLDVLEHIEGSHHIELCLVQRRGGVRVQQFDSGCTASRYPKAADERVGCGKANSRKRSLKGGDDLAGPTAHIEQRASVRKEPSDGPNQKGVPRREPEMLAFDLGDMLEEIVLETRRAVVPARLEEPYRPFETCRPPALVALPQRRREARRATLTDLHPRSSLSVLLARLTSIGFRHKNYNRGR